MVKFYIQFSGLTDEDIDTFTCDTNETVYNVLDRYLSSKKINSSLDTGDFSFKVNSFELPSPIILSSPVNYDKLMTDFIKDEGLIIMEKNNSRNYGVEGKTKIFTDVTKGSVQRGFSKTAPYYRHVGRGLNIYGICRSKGCELRGKHVIVMKGKCKIDMVNYENLEIELPCPNPKCGNDIRPITVGFYRCKFTIYGKKIENNKVEKFGPIKGVADNMNGSTYFPTTNGESTFVELVFEVNEIL